MNIDLTQNYFELFGFAEKFSISQDQLTEKYHTFQSAFHPDRFSNASDQERRVSVQTTAYINEAYATLKSDLKRSHYLLKLKNIEFNSDTETSDDAAFLMQTMELHEQVENAGATEQPLQALDNLSKELKVQQEQLISEFTKQFEKNEFDLAKQAALKLQFYERLTNQVGKKIEQFEEELL
jgi:molecular chaperone HscB